MKHADSSTGRPETSVFTTTTTHPELLLLGQQVVVLVALVQSHQNVLQPVPHTQRELVELGVHAGLDDCGENTQLVMMIIHTSTSRPHFHTGANRNI